MDWNRAKKHLFLGAGILDFTNLVEEDQSHTYTIKLHGIFCPLNTFFCAHYLQCV